MSINAIRDNSTTSLLESLSVNYNPAIAQDILAGLDANLTKTNLSNANLSNANLTGADFTDANLTDTDLTDADLTDAKVNPNTEGVNYNEWKKRGGIVVP